MCTHLFSISVQVKSLITTKSFKIFIINFKASINTSYKREKISNFCIFMFNKKNIKNFLFPVVCIAQSQYLEHSCLICMLIVSIILYLTTNKILILSDSIDKMFKDLCKSLFKCFKLCFESLSSR